MGTLERMSESESEDPASSNPPPEDGADASGIRADGRGRGRGQAPVQARLARWSRPGRFVRDLNIAALLVLVSAGAALLLLPASDDGLLGLPPLEVGAEAPRTIKAQRQLVITDAETTRRLRDEAESRVRPTYDLLLDVGHHAKAKLEAAFQMAGAWAGPTVDDDESRAARTRAFILSLGTSVEADVVAPLVAATNGEEVRDAAVMVAQTVHERRIVADKALLMLQAPDGVRLRWLKGDGTSDHEEDLSSLDTIIGIDQARAEVDATVADQLTHLPVGERRAVAVLVKRLLKPTIIPNEEETARRKAMARDAVKTVVMSFRPGEPVIRAGELLTERHLLILAEVEKEVRQESRVQASIGSALLILMLIILSYRMPLAAGARPFFASQRDLALMASVFVALLLGTWLGYKIVLWMAESFPFLAPSVFRFALPVAASALLLRFVLGPRAAASFVPVAGVTVGWMMDGSLGYSAFTMIGCLAALTVSDLQRPKMAILGGGLRIGGAQAVVVASLALLTSSFDFPTVAFDVAAALVSGVVSAVGVILMVPVVEVLFGYTTAMRLAELSDLNHPLLRELLVEAPGTYRHSIMVGTLAEAAALEVGADAQLAKVGGYYHDIGKLKNPRAFEENDARASQMISPSEQARLIRAHVADGLAIATKHRLGAPVFEIIAQHHGTLVVRNAFRRATALDLASDDRVHGDRVSRDVHASEFAYEGPKPLTVPAAIVLLADIVEAMTRDVSSASGSGQALSVREFEARVEDKVREVLDNGQLDACDLTMKDLEVIASAFVATLEDRLVRWGRPRSPGEAPMGAMIPRLVEDSPSDPRAKRVRQR
ncbi:MAG: HDIG domain-containing protein [Deltaproteobacteria bacterium]|nr:HDIG domain-containing protein [Deltaproteobacteria bacterium]